MIKTLTVDELIALLTKYPHDTKVYMSRDSEGNGYNSLDAEPPFHAKNDKTIILYPAQERLDMDEICPNEDWEEES